MVGLPEQASNTSRALTGNLVNAEQRISLLFILGQGMTELIYIGDTNDELLAKVPGMRSVRKHHHPHEERGH